MDRNDRATRRGGLANRPDAAVLPRVGITLYDAGLFRVRTNQKVSCLGNLLIARRRVSIRAVVGSLSER